MTYQAGVRIKALVKFPARVTAGDGLAVAVANGEYAFSLDFESLGAGTSIASPDSTYVPVWDEESDTYSRLTASAFGQSLSAGLYGTSTTSLSVSDGTKNLTASVGRAWQATQRLRLSSDDGTKVLSGVVTSYDPITGALVLEADYHLGSSTHADWNISPGGEVGPAGVDGSGAGDLSGPAGATDGVVALFDGATGKLLKEGSGALGALAYLGTAGTSQIDDDAVTYAKLQNISATDKVLGRSTSGAGNVEEIACTAAGRALIDDADAAAQRTTLGLGTAAILDVGTTANKVVQLTAAAKLPAVDGSLLTGIVAPGVNYQVFTSSDTWTKPSGTTAYSRVLIQIWGAGGGGSSVNNGGGGGGGAYREVWKLASDLGSTETVTVGSGGSATNAGGNSSFGSHGTAYGGGGGASSGAGGAPGGGGGGISSAGSSVGSGSTGGNGGNPSGGAGGDSSGTVNGGDSTLGGGGGGDSQSSNGGDGGSSIFGGGGGGGGANSSGGTDNGGDGGNSVYGGGGGGAQGADNNGAGGTSLYGGNGGGVGIAGTAPGGGGGRNAAGARGEVRVTVFI